MAESKTLWIGNIQPTWDEGYVGTLFNTGLDKPVSVKLIRDRATGFPVGYGFIDFVDEPAAERVMNQFNGQMIPGTQQSYRLNWGAGRRKEGMGMATPGGKGKGGGGFGQPGGGGYGGGGGAGAFAASDASIFVGDLCEEVDETLLQQTFAARFNSTSRVKIVRDLANGRPKGFGFVHFSDPMEAEQALATMQGVFIGSRAIRVNAAKGTGGAPYGAPAQVPLEQQAQAGAAAAWAAYEAQQRQWAVYQAQQAQWAAYHAQQAEAARVAAEAAAAEKAKKDSFGPTEVDADNNNYISGRNDRFGVILGREKLIDKADYSQAEWERCVEA